MMVSTGTYSPLFASQLWFAGGLPLGLEKGGPVAFASSISLSALRTTSDQVEVDLVMGRAGKAAWDVVAGDDADEGMTAEGITGGAAAPRAHRG